MSARTRGAAAMSGRRRCAARPAVARPDAGRDTAGTSGLTSCSSSSCPASAAATAGAPIPPALVRRPVPVRQRRRDRRGARSLGHRIGRAPDCGGPGTSRDDGPRVVPPVRSGGGGPHPGRARRGGRTWLVRVRPADRVETTSCRRGRRPRVRLEPSSRSGFGLACGCPRHRRDPPRPQHRLALGRHGGLPSDGRDTTIPAWR